MKGGLFLLLLLRLHRLDVRVSTRRDPQLLS